MFQIRHVARILLVALTLALILSALGFVAAQDNPSPYLGITLAAADEGVRVEGVMPGSPADEAGLRRGDIITVVEGSSVTADSLRDLIAERAVGDTISLSVTRDNETLDLSATLAARPIESDTRPFLQGPERPLLGVRLENSDSGPVIHEVTAGSGAAEAGLEVGDIIKKIGDTEITDAQAAVEAIRALNAGDVVAVEIERDGETQTVEVTLGSAPLAQFEPFRNRLGIGYNANDKTWQINGLPEGHPLYESGLRSGDVITQFDGSAYDPAELRSFLRDAGSSDITVTVQRDGEEQDITVPADVLRSLNIFNFDFGRDFGDQFPFEMPFAPMMGGARLGVEFVTLTPEVAQERDVTETAGALLTQIVPDSAAAKAGLLIDDVVTAVDGDKVDEEHTLRDRLLAYEPGDQIKLDVVRGGETMQLDVTLEQVAMGDFMPFFSDGGFQFQFPQQQPAQADGTRL